MDKSKNKNWTSPKIKPKYFGIKNKILVNSKSTSQ